MKTPPGWIWIILGLSLLSLVSDNKGCVKVGPDTPAIVTPTAPIPAEGFRVLILFDAGTDADEWDDVLYSTTIREYLNRKCVKGTDGSTPEWRMYDPDDTNIQRESQIWKDAIARPRQSNFWILISNPPKGFEGPLPKDETETLNLLKSIGGE